MRRALGYSFPKHADQRQSSQTAYPGRGTWILQRQPPWQSRLFKLYWTSGCMTSIRHWRRLSLSSLSKAPEALWQ